jgi:anti-sigma factor RsiW
MTCANSEAKAALQALFLGELDAEAHARLRAHAKTCAPCGEAYEKLSRVESALEKRVLPQQREALLEAQLMARVRAAERAAAPERRSFWEWWKVALPMAAAVAVAVVVVLPRVQGSGGPGDEWQARSGSKDGAFGVRAFCVGADGQVRGEARPGGTLACPEGAAVQFSYTAPQGARLSVAAKAASGEELQFFPREGEAVAVAPGVDVPLEHSTPVQGGWLSAPLEVRARFVDEKGQLLGETQVRLTPAK